MPKPLSTLERRILDYLVEYLRRNTYQPSIREIGRRFGIKSTKTVSEYLQSLADKGWVERDPSRSRGVRLIGVQVTPETVTVPLYTTSPARGDGPVEELELDRRLVGGCGVFCIAMIGDALEREGIRDGDLLMIEPVESCALQDGDLIYLKAGAEPIVRRCHGREASDLAHGQLQGRVINVLRRLRRPVAFESEPAEAAPALA